jgi:hypothetical protein
MFVSQHFGLIFTLAPAALVFLRSLRLLMTGNTTFKHFRRILVVDFRISLAGAFKGLLRRKIPDIYE